MIVCQDSEESPRNSGFLARDRLAKAISDSALAMLGLAIPQEPSLSDTFTALCAEIGGESRL
eukprot:CAMPEP_0206268408 /NCGR_PEP_ID=MMETSP0047_2-20121206/31691_1 /ASSEMBLY_ACC=CAM_ASM_000192 /TAXON_ID=195065 /ORGANISM="Chroomonas mesostigmatica_cf, Strain CCMP1168" /LENGTH=61 /DNA_ID=CAMNT_0053696725 /DNA_START=52 /DNA_END=234 /DNA_ORIENTATION=+